MQFMTMLKMREDAGQPPAEFFQAMDAYMAEMAKRGKVVSMGGLLPSENGALVRGTGGDVIVTHGPFAETTELVGGYAVIEAGSRDEAVELAKAFVQLHVDHWPGWEGVSEVRQVAEFDGA